MNVLSRISGLALLTVVLVGTIAPAQAAHFGLQGGYGGELDWFIGLRAESEEMPTVKNSRAVVDFNWFFPEGDYNYFEFDLNYLWALTTFAEDATSNVYVGAGLNVGRGWVSDLDDSDNWEFGMNLVGGVSFGVAEHSSFAEFTYNAFSDFDQWKIGVGFLF